MTQSRATDRSRSSSFSRRGRTLRLEPTETVWNFVSQMAAPTNPGQVREVAVFGPRGEGKTWGALMGMVLHAQAHQKAGFQLPVKWLGPTGTFEAHKSKTHGSLLAEGWGGCWRLHDQGHQATFSLNGQKLVDLRLFGAGDHDGLDRLRAEAHCAWFEEAAPAAEVGARGMTEQHWGMAVSSLRWKSHANVCVSTSNYPDEMHWTWQRWIERVQKDAVVIRIPARERTTEAQAQAWAEAIQDPIMRMRLLEGKPGTMMPGRPVAEGYNELYHVSATEMEPIENGLVYLGQDGGLMPATVIGQRRGQRLEILASLASEHAGIWQHWRYKVIPWIGEHAPWCLQQPGKIRVCYDPTMDTGSQADITTNALRVMEALLPGASFWPGQNQPFAWRRDPMTVALASMDAGVPLVAINRSAGLLRRALAGMWHYAVHYDGSVRKEEPKKPNSPWSDVGDAFAYLIADLAPLARPIPAAPRGPLRYRYDAQGRPMVLGIA